MAHEPRGDGQADAVLCEDTSQGSGLMAAPTQSARAAARAEPAVSWERDRRVASGAGLSAVVARVSGTFYDSPAIPTYRLRLNEDRLIGGLAIG